MPDESMFITPALVKKAAAWAQGMYALASMSGKPLSPDGLTIARAVGVQHPERIRVMRVLAMPRPEYPDLREAAKRYQLLGPGTIGLALGYAVFVRRGHVNDALFAHEFRHVHQFEALGSLESYLTTYFAQLIAHGYIDAPMEQDAREAAEPFEQADEQNQLGRSL